MCQSLLRSFWAMVRTGWRDVAKFSYFHPLSIVRCDMSEMHNKVCCKLISLFVALVRTRLKIMKIWFLKPVRLNKTMWKKFSFVVYSKCGKVTEICIQFLISKFNSLIKNVHQISFSFFPFNKILAYQITSCDRWNFFVFYVLLQFDLALLSSHHC